jgi:phosphatidylethanolamine-binding protein (PEBP) family uncharacterized protein
LAAFSRLSSQFAGSVEGFGGIIPLEVMASTFLRWTSLSPAAGLALVACGGDPSPSGAGGASGSSTGGSAGAGAGMAGASGSIAGGAGGSSAGGVSGGGSGGQAQAGGGAGGASGGAGGAGGGGTGGGGAGGGGGAAPFVLTSPAFNHVDTCSKAMPMSCELFPEANVMESIGGQNMSPELNWGPGPAGTMSYALCVHDLSNDFTHWCIWNIPAATLQLPANLGRQKMPPAPAGSSQDSFNQQDDGYMGSGQAGNVYDFKLYALDVSPYEPPNDEDRQGIYDELESDPDDIVLGSSLLRGRSDPEGYD